MELLLNLTWLFIASVLGVLLLASRSKREAVSEKCVYTRSTAWICYVILIALLLPAISMTDDLMAMVAPMDGEQIMRRYEVSAAVQHHPRFHIAIVQMARHAWDVPLAITANLESIPGLKAFVPPPRRLAQDRAPPAIARIAC